MNILVNGEALNLVGESTLGGLLDQLSVLDQRLAVEVNREIIPRSQHAEFKLNENDRVEIIQAVGGG